MHTWSLWGSLLKRSPGISPKFPWSFNLTINLQLIHAKNFCRPVCTHLHFPWFFFRKGLETLLTVSQDSLDKVKCEILIVFQNYLISVCPGSVQTCILWMGYPYPGLQIFYWYWSENPHAILDGRNLHIETDWNFGNGCHVGSRRVGTQICKDISGDCIFHLELVLYHKCEDLVSLDLIFNAANYINSLIRAKVLNCPLIFVFLFHWNSIPNLNLIKSAEFVISARNYVCCAKN